VTDLGGLEVFFSTEKAQKAARALEERVDRTARAVERMGKSVDKADRTFDDLAGSASKATRPVAATGAAADRAGAGLTRGGRAARDFNRRLGTLGGASTIAARGLRQLAVAATAFLGVRAGINAISSAEDNLRILQSVTGATTEELRKLEDAANDLSRSSRFSFNDGTETLIGLAKAGASAEEAIAALPSVSDLARAGLIGLEQAGDTTINTLAQFNLGIEDSVRVADQLVSKADATTSSVSSLADSLRKVGPVGRELGVSLEQVTASVALLQQQGVQPRIAGTGLARILQQLADPANGADGAAEALNRLNLTFDDVNPRNYERALENLAGANIDLQDAVALVGTEFGYLLTSLVRTRREISDLASDQDALGSASEKAAATAGTLGDSFAKLGNASNAFFRQSGQRGASAALREITDTGTEAIRILAGDTEAMENASQAGTLLANALKATAVGLAGLVTFSALSKVQQFSTAVLGSERALSSLALAARANPIVAVGTALAVAGAAFAVFGGEVGDASRELEKFQEDLADTEASARQFDAIRTALLRGTERATDSLRDLLSQQLVELRELQKTGTTTTVPAERVLSALQQRAPDAIAKLRALTEDAQRLGKSSLELATLENAVERLTGLRLQPVTEEEFSASIFGPARFKFVGIAADIESAIAAISSEFDRLEGKEGAASGVLEEASRIQGELARTGRTGNEQTKEVAETERQRVDAITRLVEERRKEVALLGATSEQQREIRRQAEIAAARIASVRELREEELAVLKQLADEEERIIDARLDPRRGERAAEILRSLRDENALLEQQGTAREALQKRQEILNSLADIGVDKTADEYQEALKLLEVYELLVEKEAERRQTTTRGGLNRGAELFRTLQQEEQALRLVGREREQYIELVRAENEARQAGLKDGAFDEYVRRRTALEELADAQERAAQTGEQVGQSLGNFLSTLGSQATTARDAVRALAEDLLRIAQNRLITQTLANLFGNIGAGLASNSNPGNGTAISGFGVTATSSFSPRLSGGYIPAMSGQVISEPTFFQRAGKLYSAAEGGRSTEEAIVPLQRDSKGRLGVASAGGGGPTIQINVTAPMNKQQAWAAGQTIGQQVKAALATAGVSARGRSGIRP